MNATNNRCTCDSISVNHEHTAACILAGAAPELLAACKAVLVFHRGGPWDDDTASEWLGLTGSADATTKVLCDVVRNAIARARQ